MIDIERTEVPENGDERVMLNAFLDAQRDTLGWKCSGLTPEQMVRVASPPSSLTLHGLLCHLTEVEYFWLEYVLLNKTEHLGIYSSEDNPADADWSVFSGSCPPNEALQRWKEACAASRSNASSLPDLDSPAKVPWDGEPVALRWITVHMIREYARHTGHADLLREAIDGSTGE
jgi:hypothetical protein